MIFRGLDMRGVTSVADLLEQRARLQSQETSFTFLRDGVVESERLSYSALQQRVHALAAWFVDDGLSGRSALMLYPPGLDFIVAFLACLYARVIPVPAVPPSAKKSATNLEAIMSDAGAVTILTSSALAPKLESLFASPEAANPYRCIATDAIANDGRRCQAPPPQRDDVAFLQYTSGSTGSPKGVVVSHGNLLHNNGMETEFFGMDDATVFLTWLPHHHDMGLIGNLLQSIFVGAPCYVMAPATFVKRPFVWLKAIDTYRATISGAPNFAYQLCVDRITDEQIEQLDLSSWRVAFNGAEPVRHATLEAFQRRFGRCGLSQSTLYPCYGMAEATLIISGREFGQPPRSLFVDKNELEQSRVVEVDAAHANAHALVSCGRLIHDQAVRIVDPNSGEPCAPHSPGEIWVSGASACLGYLNKPEITENVFRARLPGDPERRFVRSGDLGFVDRQGELFITGRLKDILIVRGRNYYPQDIEFAVANSHPALALDGVAAFALDFAGEERVVVAAEIRRTSASDFVLDDIVRSVNATLSEVFELSLFGFALLRPGRVPKTSSGKLQRSRARQLYNERALDALAYWQAETPQGAEQEAVTAIDTRNADHIALWLVDRLSGYLGLAPGDFDWDAPLSRYGLDSSLSLRIVGDISVATQREVEPTLIWEHPTINGITARIAAFA